MVSFTSILIFLGLSIDTTVLSMCIKSLLNEKDLATKLAISYLETASIPEVWKIPIASFSIIFKISKAMNDTDNAFPFRQSLHFFFGYGFGCEQKHPINNSSNRNGYKNRKIVT